MARSNTVGHALEVYQKLGTAVKKGRGMASHTDKRNLVCFPFCFTYFILICILRPKHSAFLRSLRPCLSFLLLRTKAPMDSPIVWVVSILSSAAATILIGFLTAHGPLKILLRYCLTARSVLFWIFRHTTSWNPISP